MQRDLEGGTVQRVDLWIAAGAGGREVARVRVRVPGETRDFLLVGGSAGLAMIDSTQRARLRAALRGAESGDRALWRARLDGGRVVAVGGRAIAVERDAKTWLAGIGDGGKLELGQGGVQGSASREEMQARGAEILERLVRENTDARRDALRRALAAAVARVERRMQAVRGDLDRAAAAERIAQSARVFVAEAARTPRGATKIVATDWSTGETCELALDPSRGAREQIDAMFRRAHRLKEGARIGRARLAEAEAARDSLRALATDLASSGADLDALAALARAAAPRDFRLPTVISTSGGARKRARLLLARPPHRTFLSASGARILVGRGAADNDALTFHVARPHDLWLHAKGRAGAHVVVPLGKGASCPPDLLVDAAHLAAHFSDARDERVVEVQHTARRHLQKPRRSAPGHVVVLREKVLVLRVVDETLRRLLGSEQTD